MAGRLVQLLDPARIQLGLQSTKRTAALHEVARLLDGHPDVLDFTGFYNELLARERLDSTYIGNGIALPHARTEHVGRIVLAIGRSDQGVLFENCNQTVRLMLVLGTPKLNPGDYLQLVGLLCRLFKDPADCAALFAAATPAAFIQSLLARGPGVRPGGLSPQRPPPPGIAGTCHPRAARQHGRRGMIHSFIFSDGRPVGHDLALEALRLVRADKGLMLWIDLDDPDPEEITPILSGVFQFHPLAIEDCVTPSSLPKVEDYEDYLFLVTHGIDAASPAKAGSAELDLFLGKDFLVTFHRTPLRAVQTIADRCAKATGVIARGPDRLAHLILDLLVDDYKPFVDELRSQLETIEETVLHHRSHFPPARGARRDLGPAPDRPPQRDVINRLAHGESRWSAAVLLPYFRDLRQPRHRRNGRGLRRPVADLL